uniref:Uncharacterized protein n=1 Tax=Octopus bimaculoides TaxID=37653 RepID=A0A0L8FHC2_OCTBM
MTTFYSRGRKYGTVEVQFKNKEDAKKLSTVALRTTKWTLLPTYCGRRAARISIEKVLREINVEWLVAAIVFNCKEEVEVVKVEKSREINWWGFRLEVLIHVALPDLHNIAEELELPEGTRLRVVRSTNKEEVVEEGKKEEEKKVEEITAERKKVRVDSLPKSPKKKERKKNAAKNKESTEKRTSEPEEANSKFEKAVKIMAWEGRLENQLQHVVKTGRPEGSKLRTLMFYQKEMELEKKIVKITGLMRVKLSTDMFEANQREVLIEKDTAEKLKELFPDIITNSKIFV